VVLFVVNLECREIIIGSFTYFTKTFGQKLEFVRVQVLGAHMGYYVDLTVETKLASGLLACCLSI
jgi:hypothetical protein